MNLPLVNRNSDPLRTTIGERIGPSKKRALQHSLATAQRSKRGAK